MVYLGEIVNTHGIKGELRILSDFKFKDEAFKVGNKLYIGKRQQEVVINSYRRHKTFDMVTFVGFESINDAIAFKGDDVYMKREDLDIDGYVDEDVIGLTAYDKDEVVGIVEDVIKHKQELLIISNGEKNYMIPFVEELVTVDLKNKRVNINAIEGLLNDN